ACRCGARTRRSPQRPRGAARRMRLGWVGPFAHAHPPRVDRGETPMFRSSSVNPRQTRHAALGLLLMALAGCGSNGSHSNPMAPVAPSTHSGTLVVVASAASDDASGSLSTQFTVSVADTGTGAAVSGATVEFSTPSGTVSLVEDSGTPGTYRAQRSGHD